MHRLLAVASALLLTHGAMAHSPTGTVQGGAAEQPTAHGQHAPVSRSGIADADTDGIPDFADNCSAVANADQRDTDLDGYGNVCDADLSNDGAVNFTDLGLMKSVFFTADDNADLNGDGVVNFSDLGMLKAAFFAPPGPSGMPCAGTIPCPGELEFEWPMAGNDGEDWVINNYVDLDPGPGILDYMGGAKAYDGHNGVDIDTPTFREMDNGVPVLASALGVVIDTGDGNPDRNVFCVGDWNFVTVGHPNGWTTTYGHLRKNSVAVAVGDIVNAGDAVGVVGSSGCSTAPHVHFETRDDQGAVVSPFLNNMWVSPPVYDTPMSVLDITVQDQSMAEYVEIVDPPPDLATVAPGNTIGVGVSLAGGDIGDVLTWRLADPAGATVQDFDFALPALYRHSFWVLNFFLPADLTPGAYTVEMYENGALARSHALQIAPHAADYEQVHHAVPSADYQQVFNDAVAAGYRLVWIDGYDVNGSTFFNAVFNRSPSNLWTANHNMTSAQYQSIFNDRTADGYRLTHIDSYLLGGAVRYAAIFQRQFAQSFIAYHAATVAQHQALFNDYTNLGWVVSHIAFVESGGTQTVAALYTSKPVGAWYARGNMDSATYQAEFDSNTTAGRSLRYLDVSTRAGQPSFSAIWYSNNPLTWVGRHDLTDAQYQNEAATWTGAGLRTRIVTGYDNGAGNPRFGAFWTN
ncbi:MAG: peptidoglycan DD-metalloendopeptidase family protein [Pseudomonadota bacterium]